jgi:hypothetical protein
MPSKRRVQLDIGIVGMCLTDVAQILKVLCDTARYSKANEPGVTKYTIAVLRNGSGLDVFAFEEYVLQTLNHQPTKLTVVA